MTGSADAAGGRHGVLVVDKPAGPTSHDIVLRARRALGERRVGHTGTLDPFATGVLALCVGRATRLARFLTAGPKEYHATVQLGQATATDDLTGEPLGPAQAVHLSPAEVERACRSLVGTFDQLPPAFSAKQHGGRRAYEQARAGLPVERRPCRVTVTAIDVLRVVGPLVELRVACSAGTYVRALGRDLGLLLGVGAHLRALRRTRSGEFGLERAVPGSALLPGAMELVQRLVPLGQVLAHWPAVRVTPEGRRALGFGRDLGGRLLAGEPPRGVERVRVLDEAGDLLALALPVGPSRASGADWHCHPDIVLLE